MSTVEALDILDVEARVFETGNDGDARGDADTIIPGSILEGTTTISERLQEWAGEAAISWDGTDDEYKGVVTANDRVELVYQIANEASEEGGSGASYGAASYGEASHAGVGFSVTSWSGQAHTPSFETYGGPHENGQRITRYDLDLVEYVFGIMQDRIIYGAFSGTVSDIVRDVVGAKCPEIDLSGVEDIDYETDREFDGRRVNEVVVAMAETGDAVIDSDGRTLIFKPLEDIPTQFDLAEADYGGLSSDGDDDSLATLVRVDGGADINVDEQTAEDDSDIDSYHTVTEDDRLTYELDPEKNRLDQVDVWVRDADTEESVEVRIQAPNSDGTGPRAPADDTKDIVSDSSGDVLPDDGWRDRFRMSREPLPSRPWLIIQSSGVDGQDIGLNADGDPAFRTHYPYQIAVQIDSRAVGSDALDRYGIVERSYTDDSLTRFSAARDVGEASLIHNQYPDINLSLEAMRRRSHELSTGDVISMTLDEYGSEYVGEYIVMERDRELLPAGTARTILSLQSVASL